MSRPDAGEIRRFLGEAALARLEELEVFARIDSTNTYLLAQAAPAPGRFRVAMADEQTAGRGRQSRRWISPPGAGLYLSLAYTFVHVPRQLPALTLALGVGVIAALESYGDAAYQLKWPNDIIARDAKLGGILTEARSTAGDGVTVVAGVGLNVDLPADMEALTDSTWSLQPVGSSTACSKRCCDSRSPDSAVSRKPGGIATGSKADGWWSSCPMARWRASRPGSSRTGR